LAIDFASFGIGTKPLNRDGSSKPFNEVTKLGQSYQNKGRTLRLLKKLVQKHWHHEEDQHA